jgi:GNAT superfamily N-acetyltransferase
LPIEPLNDNHDLNAFDCGVDSLNTYLKRYARQKARRNLGQTYILTENDQVIGYYTISVSELVGEMPGNVPRRVGVILLGRIAVDRQYQGRGLGDELLLHSLTQAQQIGEIAGAHAVYLDVEPTNPGVKDWYLGHGFQEIPNNPNRLYLRLETIRQLRLTNED